jgi:hypothetical protein
LSAAALRERFTRWQPGDHVDSMYLAGGHCQAHPVVDQTPYQVPPIPVTLTVEGFSDLALSIRPPDPVPANCWDIR